MKLGIKICTIMCIVFSLQINAGEKNKKTSPTAQDKKTTAPQYFTFNNPSNSATALVRATSTFQHIQASHTHTSAMQSNSVSTKTSKPKPTDVKKRDSSSDSSPESSPEEKKRYRQPRTRPTRTVSLATAQRVAQEVIQQRKEEGKRVHVTPEPSPATKSSSSSKKVFKQQPRSHAKNPSGDYTDIKGNKVHTPQPAASSIVNKMPEPSVSNSPMHDLTQKALAALLARKLQPPQLSNRDRASIYHSSPTPTPSAVEHMTPSTPSQYGSYLGDVASPTQQSRKPRIKNSISSHMKAPQDQSAEEEPASIETVDESGSDDDGNIND